MSLYEGIASEVVEHALAKITVVDDISEEEVAQIAEFEAQEGVDSIKKEQWAQLIGEDPWILDVDAFEDWGLTVDQLLRNTVRYLMIERVVETWKGERV